MQYVHDGLYFLHNHDIDGKPLFINTSRLHFKNQRDQAELLRVFIYWIERLWRQSNYDKFTMIIDLSNSGLSNSDLGYTRTVVNIIKNYYPNTVNYLLIFEMPWVLNGEFV